MCSPRGRIKSLVATFSSSTEFVDLRIRGYLPEHRIIGRLSLVAVARCKLLCNFSVLFMKVFLCSLAEVNMHDVFSFSPCSFLLDLRILISEFLKKMRL